MSSLPAACGLQSLSTRIIAVCGARSDQRVGGRRPAS